MRNKKILTGLLFSFLLLSFKYSGKEGVIIISEVTQGNSTYVLKCNKHYNTEHKLIYQYYLEIHSDKNPKTNFDSDFENYIQFHLHELFTLKQNGQTSRVFGARLEQGIKGTNIYRINLYFEKDSSKKIKNLEVDFDDRLFENTRIILTAKKVNL